MSLSSLMGSEKSTALVCVGNGAPKEQPGQSGNTQSVERSICFVHFLRLPLTIHEDVAALVSIYGHAVAYKP